MLKKMLLASGGNKGIQFVGGYSVGYAGQTTDKTISLTSLTGGLDTQPSDGDIVIVINGLTTNASQPVPVLPSGYTQLLNSYSTDTYRVGGTLSYKIMGSTPDTSLTLVGGTKSIYSGGSTSVLVFRGVNLTNPIDVTSIGNVVNGTVKSEPPAITPTTQGAIIIGGGLGAHITNTGIFTSSEYQNFISSAGDDSYDCTTAIGYQEWVSGVFNPTQFGFTATDHADYSCLGYSMVLRPQ